MFSEIAYHTCRDQGSFDEIRGAIPFISRDTPNQWLSQGYYFWASSDFWAKKWLGNQKKVISKFSITMERSRILDTVTSHDDQNKLAAMYLEVKKHFTQAYPNTKVHVGSVIQWLRKSARETGDETYFPYWAIKCRDQQKHDTLDFPGNFSECLPILDRQQICVYPEYKSKTIQFIEFVHPDEFSKRCKGEQIAIPTENPLNQMVG